MNDIKFDLREMLNCGQVNYTNSNQLWCVYLNKKNLYAMQDGERGYAEVYGMKNSTTFPSKEEALEFIFRAEVLNGKPVKYYESIPDEPDEDYDEH